MRLVTCTLALVVAACSSDAPQPKADAAPLGSLPPPELEPVVTRTPNPYVEVRGHSEGARVIGVGSSAGPVPTVVLSDGSFCLTAPFEPPGPTRIGVLALDAEGRMSKSVVLEPTYDESAPDPGLACRNPAPQCVEAEACGADGIDDDCNGWTDQCDLACSGCQDDALEPNDFPFIVPTIRPGTYHLELCPCRDDWFELYLPEGRRLHAVLDFTHEDIDVDVRLYRSESIGVVDPAVASSTGTTDQEVIDFTAEMEATYFLRVYPYGDDPAGAYSITLD
jgi:hypothetical protein